MKNYLKLWCIKTIFPRENNYMPSRLKSNCLFISLVLSCVSLLFFDSLISSGSIISLRFLYDVAFFLIFFPLISFSVYLINGGYVKTNYSIDLNALFYLFTFIINIKVIFSTVFTRLFVGTFNLDIFAQGLAGLPSIIEFSLMLLLNGTLLMIILNRKDAVHFTQIPIYALCILGIQTIVTLIAFNAYGLTGLKFSMVLLHAILSVAVLLVGRISKWSAKFSFSSDDLWLIMVSLGLFLMMYIPYGTYSVYGDNAVIIDSSISIVLRNDLTPFYISDTYYSPIGGFIATIFNMSTGIGNIFLASIYPFFAAYIFLPFIIYVFTSKFLVKDSRYAIIAAIAVILMDGLAVFALINSQDLSIGSINNQISSQTMALYRSTLGWFWLIPYKVMSVAAAICVPTIIEKSKISFILGGVLLCLAFINFRQPIVAFALLIFVFVTGKTSLKNLATLIFSAIIFLFPMITVICYKISDFFVYQLFAFNLLDLTATRMVKASLQAFYFGSNVPSLILIILGLSGLLISIFPPKRLTTKLHFDNKWFELKEKNSYHAILIGLKLGRNKVLRLNLLNALLVVLMFLPVVLCILNVNNLNPLSLDSKLVSTFNYLLLRYHILLISFIIGLFLIRFPRRILFCFAFFSIASYLSLLLGFQIFTPIFGLIMGLPLLFYFVSKNKKLLTCCFLFIVFLGVFSGTVYAGSVKTNLIETKFSEASAIVSILVDQNYREKVYSPASYTYYVSRITRMANLEMTSTPSAGLILIDKDYTTPEVINVYLTSGQPVLFNGQSYVLLKGIN